MYEKLVLTSSESATNDHDCDINASYSDIDGSYDCTCNSGYTATASGDAQG